MALLLGRKFKPRSVLFKDDLRIVWNDQSERSYNFYDLRCKCPCAECVDEMTSERTVQPQDIDQDIHIVAAEYVGNYALRIRWSDGHNSGIYTFRSLHEMALDKISESDK